MTKRIIIISLLITGALFGLWASNLIGNWLFLQNSIILVGFFKSLSKSPMTRGELEEKVITITQQNEELQRQMIEMRKQEIEESEKKTHGRFHFGEY